MCATLHREHRLGADLSSTGENTDRQRLYIDYIYKIILAKKYVIATVCLRSNREFTDLILDELRLLCKHTVIGLSY